MIHYTLNTGHAVESPDAGVGNEALATLGSLAACGGVIPGFAPFRVTVTHNGGGSVFTVWRAREPIVTCGLAWEPKAEQLVWTEIERLYLELSDRQPELVGPGQAPAMPKSLPWLAVVLMPSLVLQTREDVAWLGDFERCLAWTILKCYE